MNVFLTYTSYKIRPYEYYFFSKMFVNLGVIK
jgi:hypothetical protein